MENLPVAPVLTRITTRYVALEDRIRLAGEVEGMEGVEGASEVSVWLTRRLLQRLLPKLLRGLELAPANPAGGAPAPGDGLRGELLQGFAQRKAMAGMTQVAPVRVAADGAQWVAETAVISRSAGGVTLSLRAADGREVLLPLGGNLLRQWLAIVYRAYVRAEWPADFWPDWLAESVLPTAPAGLTVH